jgi:hypothetical protein
MQATEDAERSHMGMAVTNRRYVKGEMLTKSVTWGTRVGAVGLADVPIERVEPGVIASGEITRHLGGS